MIFLILVVLFVIFFVVPFVLGFFERGYEWVLKPSKYLNLYLLKVVELGNEFYTKVLKK